MPQTFQDQEYHIAERFVQLMTTDYLPDAIGNCYIERLEYLLHEKTNTDTERFVLKRIETAFRSPSFPTLTEQYDQAHSEESEKMAMDLLKEFGLNAPSELELDAALAAKQRFLEQREEMERRIAEVDSGAPAKTETFLRLFQEFGVRSFDEIKDLPQVQHIIRSTEAILEHWQNRGRELAPIFKAEQEKGPDWRAWLKTEIEMLKSEFKQEIKELRKQFEPTFEARQEFLEKTMAGNFVTNIITKDWLSSQRNRRLSGVQTAVMIHKIETETGGNSPAFVAPETAPVTSLTSYFSPDAALPPDQQRSKIQGDNRKIITALRYQETLAHDAKDENEKESTLDSFGEPTIETLVETYESDGEKIKSVSGKKALYQLFPKEQVEKILSGEVSLFTLLKESFPETIGRSVATADQLSEKVDREFLELYTQAVEKIRRASEHHGDELSERRSQELWGEVKRTVEEKAVEFTAQFVEMYFQKFFQKDVSKEQLAEVTHEFQTRQRL